MAAARRRRLPARVYWVRRALALSLVVALVVGVAHLVGGTGTDEAPVADRATTVGSAPTTAPQVQLGPTVPAKVRPRQLRGAVPALPSGPCSPEDLSTVPSVPGGTAEAGAAVTIRLALRGTQPACTFEVSPDSVAVKVATSDESTFWSSQDCPGAIPRETVVVRSADPTMVDLSWTARDSLSGCRAQASWALPGSYRVHATVQGSTPADRVFALVRPGVRYVTETPDPTPTPAGRRQRDRQDAGEDGQPAAQPTPRPTAAPSATARPEGRRTPRGPAPSAEASPRAGRDG